MINAYKYIIRNIYLRPGLFYNALNKVVIIILNNKNYLKKYSMFPNLVK